MVNKKPFKRSSQNPKRRIALSTSADDCTALAAAIGYGGNPEHKKNPGDFSLIPPAAAQADSTLCDITGVFTKAEALATLKAGVLQGLVSVQTRNGLPQNIWSVVNGIAIEAELENEVLAVYHGYPLTVGEPLEREVLSRWKSNA